MTPVPVPSHDLGRKPSSSAAGRGEAQDARHNAPLQEERDGIS
jgi:hypothetical protein